MKASDIKVGLAELVIPLAKTVDMMSPAVANHHQEVAYFALRIGEEMGLSKQELQTLVITGMVHDVGAFSLDERLNLLEFECRMPDRHCSAGYELLRGFKPFSEAAEIIRFHHVRWKDGEGARKNGAKIPLASHVIHLADRLAILVPKNIHALSKVRDICQEIEERRGDWFHPDMVDAVLAFAKHDHVWLDVVSRTLERPLQECLRESPETASLDELLEFGDLVCRLIDFRSPFTATHTSGLAATAVALAERLDFNDDEQKIIRLAADLHDLGKLAVPLEILEKPGRLTEDEWHTMRSHVYYTFQALAQIPALEALTSWSALHQERLNGSGYPFGYAADRLPAGARVLAVADVFVGITEDRPYRKGMTETEARNVLEEMAANRELDPDVVRVLLDDFETFNVIRGETQDRARQAYARFRENCELPA